MKALFRPFRGVTLLIPGTGPAHDVAREHLYIVLTDTDNDGNNLLVPVCSVRGSRFDRACILGEGDHDFIRHQSYVFYARMDLYSANVLTSRVVTDDIQYMGVVESRILGLICAGIANSSFCKPRLKRYFIDQTSGAPEGDS